VNGIKILLICLEPTYKTKMNHSCENQECPICMDSIEGNKNCVTTECGHTFHAKCLMTSVAHNGFACPYCRTAMAEVPEDEDDDDDDSDGEYDEDDEENFDDDALRGFRFFMNNLNSEDHSEQDIEEEEVFLQYSENTEPEEPEVPVPTASFITEKLTQQGVTMEDLVKIMLLNHNEYDRQTEQLERLDGEMFGKLRIIISNFTPQHTV
jgi:hypothetical protein